MSDIELIKKYLPESKWQDAIKKLETGYPVQYIIGNVEFFDCIINVDENVLIPRFETEYLVEKTIKYLQKMNVANPNILDIGTGSGCISIALKRNLNCNILAIDISEEALKIAKKNAKDNNVLIKFEEWDIHKFKSSNKFDLIISNPPYVPFDGKIDEKIKYEPQNAIFAKEKGLYFYKIIIEKVINNLKENYLIAFEIGDNQGNELSQIIKQYLPNSFILLEKDYNNYDRYLFISNLKEIFE